MSYLGKLKLEFLPVLFRRFLQEFIYRFFQRLLQEFRSRYHQEFNPRFNHEFFLRQPKITAEILQQSTLGIPPKILSHIFLENPMSGMDSSRNSCIDFTMIFPKIYIFKISSSDSFTDCLVFLLKLSFRYFSKDTFWKYQTDPFRKFFRNSSGSSMELSKIFVSSNNSR